MRSKRLYLIIYLFIVGILVFGNLALIVRQWESSKKTVDGFSERYEDISINKNDESDITVEQLIHSISDGRDKVRIQKMTDCGYSYIYLHHMSLPVHLVEGRNFEEKDFTEHKNVVIIDEEMANHTYEIEGVTYFSVDGAEYEVIGIFEKEINDIHTNTSIFINMMSEQSLNCELVEGRYLIEGVNLSALEEVVDVHFNKNVYEIDTKTRWNIVSESLIFSTKIIAGCILFCIIGLMYMIYLWLHSVNQVIDVAIICGATAKRAALDILKKYLVVVCVSGIIPVSLFLILTQVMFAIWFVLIWIVVNLTLCWVELIIMRMVLKVHRR